MAEFDTVVTKLRQVKDVAAGVADIDAVVRAVQEAQALVDHLTRDQQRLTASVAELADQVRDTRHQVDAAEREVAPQLIRKRQEIALQTSALNAQLADLQAQHAAKVDGFKAAFIAAERDHVAQLAARIAELDRAHTAEVEQRRAALTATLRDLEARCAAADRDAAAADERLRAAKAGLAAVHDLTGR